MVVCIFGWCYGNRIIKCAWFEKPIVDLENQIREMRGTSSRPGHNLENEIRSLEARVSELLKDVYGKLGTWERVLLSRHFNRPHTIDYIHHLITDFHPLSGDRHFADDPSMIAGLGHFQGEKIAVIGIEKGQKTKEKIHHNFGMPRPEGYRKAFELWNLPEDLEFPSYSLIPPGLSGVEAEERGRLSDLKTWKRCLESQYLLFYYWRTVVGKALAIAVADRVLMMEFSSILSSPKLCLNFCGPIQRAAM